MRRGDHAHLVYERPWQTDGRARIFLRCSHYVRIIHTCRPSRGTPQPDPHPCRAAPRSLRPRPCFHDGRAVARHEQYQHDYEHQLIERAGHRERAEHEERSQPPCNARVAGDELRSADGASQTVV